VNSEERKEKEKMLAKQRTSSIRYLVMVGTLEWNNVQPMFIKTTKLPGKEIIGNCPARFLSRFLVLVESHLEATTLTFHLDGLDAATTRFRSAFRSQSTAQNTLACVFNSYRNTLRPRPEETEDRKRTQRSAAGPLQFAVCRFIIQRSRQTSLLR